MIKLLGGLVCGLLVACGGAVQGPSQHASTLDMCEGGVARNDAGLTRYEHCALITGDLAISGVTSLSALSQLRGVSGRLSVSNTTELEGLEGLEHLATVKQLELRGNSHLLGLSGLEQLRHAGEIVIHGNPELRTLSGLEGIEQLEGLSVSRSGLYSLHGVENVSQLAKLSLIGNRELIDPSALNDARGVREVVVQHNPRLCAHFGLLPRVTHPERVSFYENAALERATVRRFVEPRSQATLAAR